jgi:hypothetical protein
MDSQLLSINQAKIGERSPYADAPIDHSVAPRLLLHFYNCIPLAYAAGTLCLTSVELFLTKRASLPHTNYS